MIGKVLDGRYSIVRLLGNGGMGAVYLAHHVDLGKPVAVKIMHPQLMMDDRTVQRFKHEIKAMSNLSHPNLISIIDAGSTDYGTPYFVMEYLPSRPLSDVLADEVFLPGDRVKKIIAQCADALSHAHARNIIHRDLKPANILVIESGAKDHIKIVDLGVAKLIGGDAGELQKLTQTGEVFGSPLYMAPEQVLGKPHDGRTDIYQLGCVLFEMVTGVPPLVKNSAIMTMNSHVTEEAPTFNQVMPDLPMDDNLRQLERIVLKCLAKNPADRYQSMNQLLQAVERDAVADQQLAVRSHAKVQQPLAPASAQPKSEQPKSIKERFLAGKVEATEDFEFIEPVAKVEKNHEASARVSSVRRVAKARQHAAKAGGLEKNHLIIGGAVVLFLVAVVAVVGIWSIISAPHVDEQKAPTKIFKITEFKYPAVASDPLDVRVLSVYEGSPVDKKVPSDSVRSGVIDVDVEAENTPLVLVLNSYMPTTWNLRKATDKVKISKVITVGYYHQKVNGVPLKAVHPEIYAFDKDGSQNKKFTTSDLFFFLFLPSEDLKTDSEYVKMQSLVEKLTKSHVRNFQGVRTTTNFTVE